MKNEHDGINLFYVVGIIIKKKKMVIALTLILSFLAGIAIVGIEYAKKYKTESATKEKIANFYVVRNDPVYEMIDDLRAINSVRETALEAYKNYILNRAKYFGLPMNTLKVDFIQDREILIAVDESESKILKQFVERNDKERKYLKDGLKKYLSISYVKVLRETVLKLDSIFKKNRIKYNETSSDSYVVSQINFFRESNFIMKSRRDVPIGLHPVYVLQALIRIDSLTWYLRARIADKEIPKKISNELSVQIDEYSAFTNAIKAVFDAVTTAFSKFILKSSILDLEWFVVNLDAMSDIVSGKPENISYNRSSYSEVTIPINAVGIAKKLFINLILFFILSVVLVIFGDYWKRNRGELKKYLS